MTCGRIEDDVADRGRSTEGGITVDDEVALIEVAAVVQDGGRRRRGGRVDAVVLRVTGELPTRPGNLVVDVDAVERDRAAAIQARQVGIVDRDGSERSRGIAGVRRS